jgi:hypothetical protein
MRRRFLLAALVACGPAGSNSGDDGGNGDGGSDISDGSGNEASDGAACTAYVPPKCDAAPPDPGAKRGFRHTASSITANTGFANHRGRDMFYNPGDPQWLIGKFAYGVLDDDIKDEEIDIYLLRDCGSTWEKLGTELTTQDNQHAPVEGVDDTGGRI